MRALTLMMVILAALAAATAFAQTTGVPRLTDLWRLPLPESGVLPFGESSHDLSGRNQDGFFGIYSRLYHENGLHVLYDSPGPGCIYRMWFTHLTLGSHLVIYVDDASSPAVDMDIAEFFAGKTEPFTPPLVWDDLASSGGFVSYVPICYAKRLIVGTTRWTFFYNFTAHGYRGDAEVASFTGEEDYSAARTIYDPSRAGFDPKDASSVEYHPANVTLGPGQTATLFAASGPGQIASLRLTPTTLNGDLLQQVRLIARFDGASRTAVDLPIGLFFGATEAGSSRALLFGLKDGALYSFFPMPYFSAAKLELANDGAASYTIAAEIGVLDEAPDDRAAWFEAVHRESNPPVRGLDHVFVETTGQGKVVGVIQASAGMSGLRFLEGDERFYLDNLGTPTIQGTGTEDYYNGGWYFNQGVFNLPTHGHPAGVEGEDWSAATMYRLHLGDTLDFHDGARFSIEHDAQDLNIDEIYHSAAFLYRIGEPALVLEAEFDVGDAAAEAAFGYHGDGDKPTGEMRFFYEGDFDLTAIADSGYRTTRSASFTAKVNPGADGVRLVRRIDQKDGRELLRVWINGQEAGLWGSPEHNAFKRWRDAVFDVSPAFTAGADQLNITLENAAPGRTFTQFRYWVYSWKRPLLSRLQSLSLTAPAESMNVGETMQFTAGGPYPSGATEDVTTWVEYDLDDPELGSIEYGRLRALQSGDLTVAARTGALVSNPVKIRILDDSPTDDDDNDDQADDDQADDDDDASPPPAELEHSANERCGC
jgi:hypothetical protein